LYKSGFRRSTTFAEVSQAPNGTSAASFGSASVRRSHNLPFASGAKLAVAAHLASELSAICTAVAPFASDRGFAQGSAAEIPQQRPDPKLL
jgi:hypothetical protein